MPVYEYKCKTCGKEFSIFFTSYDTGEVKCPFCGGKDVKKCISTIMRMKKGEGSGEDSSCGPCSSNSCPTCGI